MTEKKYIDIKGMQNKVDKENKKKSEKFRANLNAQNKRRKKEQDELNNLFAKAVLSERNENERKRVTEIEAEKAKSVADIESKYERKGVKSEATKQKEKAYKNMLANLRGMNNQE
ncbi:hypothetical protein [Enterococcus faecium]|uniref:hypothetical protein n=1 Tax=Enterococcus TaxID=1350 RepID=UPI000DE98A82|nr:hypothetical protein [Enterococcus faecium]RBT28974.1 hypothetical protein EA72_00992 [Enterococcus faecium]RBT31381.1 hypothetical protein EB01_01308 [Enterococcus faecium]